MSDEKLPAYVSVPAWADWEGARRRRNIRYQVLSCITTIVLALTGIYLYCFKPMLSTQSHVSPLVDMPDFRIHPVGAAPAAPMCPQVNRLVPGGISFDDDPIRQKILTEDYRQEALEKYSKAIQFETVSTDEMNDPDFPLDAPEYKDFIGLREYLNKSFPGVYKTMKPQTVNVHGLLYAWTGSDPNLKPTLLLAHYDVVPVSDDTLDEWTHGPFSGKVAHDDTMGMERIYGRGAVDMKHAVISILEALELLVEHNFQPRRTILVGFGFDEEIGGLKGAKRIGEEVHRCVGDNGVAVAIDEGSGEIEMFKTSFVAPATAEKGSLNVQIDIRSPGGHSSAPDEHTGIGIAADLIARLENETYNTYLSDDHPIMKHLSCALEHADPAEFDGPLRELTEKRLSGIYQPPTDNDQLALALSRGASPNGSPDRNVIHWVMTTSQAVTVIFGGFKINALPDLVTVKINHRIHIEESPTFVKEKIERVARAVGSRFDIPVYHFNETNGNSSFTPPRNVNRSISLVALSSLEPAPLTPTDIGSEDAKTPYRILAGSVREVMGTDKIVSSLMTAGNTDTRHYWKVTHNLMRFGPGTVQEDAGKIHTVDESMSIEGHFKGVEWFTVFIRNMDEADLVDDTLAKSFTCWDEYAGDD